MSHTEGNLHYQEESDAYTHIARDVNGRIIFSTPQGSKGTDEANARRLVACWNACDGLPQDALDGGWTAAGISQYAKRLEGERDALKAENERLREAADRAEGFLFAVSLMPQLGPNVRDVALKHHEALRAAMKETK